MVKDKIVHTSEKRIKIQHTYDIDQRPLELIATLFVGEMSPDIK